MIDRNPAVGRILVAKGDIEVALASRGGVITKLPGKQLWFKTNDGKDRYVLGFAAICDTEEEVEKIIELSTRAVMALRDVRNKHEKEFFALFSK